MSADSRPVPPTGVRRQIRFLEDPILRRYFSYVSGSRFIEGALHDDVTRILDVGTGAGRFPALLNDEHREFVGIDLSASATRAARLNTDTATTAILRADGSSLPLVEDAVDVVIAVGTFNRIADLEPFLAEFGRVIRPGGSIVFNVNNARTIFLHKQQSFQSHFTVDELRDALGASGFDMVDARRTFFATRKQKQLIFSERMPATVRWIGLWITVALSLIAERLPLVESFGGHIWVHARRPTDIDDGGHPTG